MDAIMDPLGRNSLMTIGHCPSHPTPLQISDITRWGGFRVKRVRINRSNSDGAGPVCVSSRRWAGSYNRVLLHSPSRCDFNDLVFALQFTPTNVERTIRQLDA